MYMTVNHTYLFTNYTHSDMFRLERVITRLFIEPNINASAHFGITKVLQCKNWLRLLQ